MFYIRKPDKKKSIIIREASAEDLYNYKNRFNRVEPDDVAKPDNSTNDTGQLCDCKDFIANELFFINCEISDSELLEKI